MDTTPDKLSGLADQIRRWGNELGFQQVGFGSIELDEDERHLEQWLAAGEGPEGMPARLPEAIRRYQEQYGVTGR